MPLQWDRTLRWARGWAAAVSARLASQGTGTWGIDICRHGTARHGRRGRDGHVQGNLRWARLGGTMAARLVRLVSTPAHHSLANFGCGREEEEELLLPGQRAGSAWGGGQRNRGIRDILHNYRLVGSEEISLCVD